MSEGQVRSDGFALKGLKKALGCPNHPRHHGIELLTVHGYDMFRNTDLAAQNAVAVGVHLTKGILACSKLRVDPLYAII